MQLPSAALAVAVLAVLPGAPSLLPAPGRALQDEALWHSLRLPRLCAPRPLPALPASLAEPGHVHLPRPRTRAEARGEAPDLPVGVCMQMLDELVRADDLTVELHRIAPPVLARGEASGVARLERALAGLDAFAAALAIEVEVVLVPARSEAATPPAVGGSAETGGADGALRGTTRVRSGAPFVVGERATTAFVGNFSVEVATDSGAAAPITGEVVTGRAVHARAWRVRGGTAVHVAGTLDLAELEGFDELDPQTGDLGVFQQPRVRSAQVAFAGTVASGESLRVSLAGSGLERPDWTLWITARTSPDPAPEDGVGWSGLDLALLGDRPTTLVRAHPGAGLSGLRVERELASDVEPLPASALAAELEGRLARRRSVGDDLGLSVRAAGDLLLLPCASPRAWREARALVTALEESRLAGARVVVRHGPLACDLPVTAGAPARVLVGRERTWLVDYEVEIAAETWMPSPRVETSLDGVCVELLPGPSGARAACWVATSADPREADRTTTALGRLQLVSRGFAAERAELRRGDGPHTVLEARTGAPALELEVR